MQILFKLNFLNVIVSVGTTVTGLLASLVSYGTDTLQIALCHLFFNISGIIIWYPRPYMHKISLNAARSLGRVTRVWRRFPIVYILLVFVTIPLLLLGISSLFNQGSKAFTVFGSFLSVLFGLALIYFVFRWYFCGMREKIYANFKARERKRQTMTTLPDDIPFIMNELARLRNPTGLAELSPSEDDKED